MTVTCAGGFVTALDAVVVGTALPSIARELKATTAELAWTGAAYVLASAVLQPIWPTISELTGRKPALGAGFVLFFAGSLVAALAQHTSVLIVGRTIQGLGAGNIMLLCNILISDLFPLQERGPYIGLYAAASCLGAALGPVMGGLLTSYVGWRWCFWINLPFAGVTFGIVTLLLDLPKLPSQTGTRDLRRVDWIGSALICTATTLFLIGLQSGGNVFLWTSPTVIGLLVGGCTAAALFFFQQRSTQNPIIPPRIFSTVSSAACLIIGFFHGFTYIACLYYLPLYFQVALGASPVESGVWLLIMAIPMSFITVGAALLVRKTGRYRPTICVSAGALTLGVGLAIAFPAHRNWALLVVVQLLLSVGIGPLFQAPLLALQASAHPQDASRANGAFAFTRTMSSAIGLVVGQVVLQNELKSRLPQLSNEGIPEELLGRVAKEITALSELSNLLPVQRHALQVVLTVSLSRLWAVSTATAGLCLLAGGLVRDHCVTAS